MNNIRSGFRFSVMLALVAASIYCAHLLTPRVVEWVISLQPEHTVSFSALKSLRIGVACSLLLVFGLLSTKLLIGRRSTLPFLGLTRLGFRRREIALCAISTVFLEYVVRLLASIALGGYLDGFRSDVPSYGDGLAHRWESFIAVGMFAVGPGLSEEILFRGLFLRESLARFSSRTAIAIVALTFAALHSTLVIPGAFWLTILAWKSNSLWPSIAGHMAVNLTVGVCIQLDWLSTGAFPSWGHLVAWSVGLPCFVILSRKLLRDGPGDSSSPLPSS